jgi:hypothetical protein
MEQAGGAAVDLSRDAFEVGDRLIVPSNNANAYPLPGEVAVSLGDHLVPEPRWIRTTSGADGAGFYASNVGPFPYVLGPTTPDFYRVFEVRHRFAFTPEEKSSQRHATVVRRQQ